MKFRRFMVFLCICAAVFTSCDMDEINDSYSGYFPSGKKTRNFIAQNLEDDEYYLYPAQLQYIGEKCEIWVEDGWNIPQNMIYDLAYTYDRTIFPRMMNAFNTGEAFLDQGRVVARNPMELADYYGDGNNKLCIFLLDIEDGYSGSGGYVAGYFAPVNLFSHEVYSQSNECDMIFIDIYPGLNDINNAKGTLAHEMQHMINFMITVYKRAVYNGDGEIIDFNTMDIWIDEGLAVSSEWIWSGKHAQDRIDWHYDDPTGWITYGNNFFVWENHTDIKNPGNASPYGSISNDPDAVLDDYSTAYLFFQWLRLQAGGNADIYKTIINSEESDYKAVMKAARNSISANYTIDMEGWRLLLRNWYAANFINASTGPYGYRGDPAFKKITSGYFYSKEPVYHYFNFHLFPGEGVFGLTEYPPYHDFDTNIIKYAGIDPDSSSGVADLFIPDHETKTGYNYLLTYNIDLDDKGTTEIVGIPLNMGTVSGQISASSGIVSGSRNYYSLQRTVPDSYPISAGEMLRRNGFAEENQEQNSIKLRIKTADE